MDQFDLSSFSSGGIPGVDFERREGRFSNRNTPTGDESHTDSSMGEEPSGNFDSKDPSLSSKRYNGNASSIKEGSFIDDVSIDSRLIRTPRTLFVALGGKTTNGHSFVLDAFQNGASFAMVSSDWKGPPELEERLIRTDCTQKGLQRLASMYRSTLPTTIVAITGSLGKTMLKDLLAHLFTNESVSFSPESFNNKIGVSLSLFAINSSHSLSFIEMAATEKGEMDELLEMTKPTIALVTNFFRKRFGTQKQKETVAHEISSVMHNTPVVLGEKDPHISVPPSCTFFPWNIDHPELPSIATTHTLQCTFPDQSVFTLPIPSREPYILELLQLAIKTAYKLGLDSTLIIERISSWRPEAMRTEIWRNKQDTTFVNGTYSETPLSFESSLQDFATYTSSISQQKHAKTVLVFGGLKNKHPAEGLEDKRIATSIKAHNIHEVHLYPQTFGQRLLPYLKDIPAYTHDSLESCLEACSKRPHDTIFFKGPKKIPFDWLIHEIEESPPNTLASINLAAIRANIELLKQKLPPKTRIMIMVKALAYGTDDVRLAHFLMSCGIDILGVSYVDEGVNLRKMGVTQSIFVVHAAEFEMEKALHWNLEIGLSALSQVDKANEVAKKMERPFSVHLHVDTGMKRFGCKPEEAIDLAKRISESSYLSFQGVFTHFCVADDPTEDSFTLNQAAILSSIKKELDSIKIFPKHYHAANSAAAIRFSFPDFNMVRIGLATYGYHASSSVDSLPLRPALSLFTKIVGFNDAKTGETVSYGRCHVVQQKTAKIAVLPIGYYDGIHRIYSGKAHVMIRGQLAPMIGRICMDYMMIDVTHIQGVKIGDTALLFGEDESGAYISPETLASSGGSIVHELMTCLGPRVQRLFIYDESLATR